MQLETYISMKIDNCIVSVPQIWIIRCVSSSTRDSFVIMRLIINTPQKNQSFVAFLAKLGDHYITKVDLDIEFLEFQALNKIICCHGNKNQKLWSEWTKCSRILYNLLTCWLFENHSQ